MVQNKKYNLKKIIVKISGIRTRPTKQNYCNVEQNKLSTEQNKCPYEKKTILHNKNNYLNH